VDIQKIRKYLKENYDSHFLFAVTDKSEDDNLVMSIQMSKSDALYVICRLIEEFKLDPDRVAYACKQVEEERGPLM
jgi:hypothetical protein